MQTPRFGGLGRWAMGLTVLVSAVSLSACSKWDWNKPAGMDAATESLFLSQCKQMDLGGPGLCGCGVQNLLQDFSLADFLAMGADQVPPTPEFIQKLQATREKCVRERGL